MNGLALNFHTVLLTSCPQTWCFPPASTKCLWSFIVGHCCPSLAHLALSFVTLPAAALVTALQGCPNISHLTILNFVRFDDWTQAHSEQLKAAAPNLKHLHLNNWATAHVRVLGVLGPQLETAVLHGCGIDDDDDNEPWDESDDEMDEDDIRCAATKALGGCSRLQHLELSGVFVTPAILAALTSLPHLSYASVSDAVGPGACHVLRPGHTPSAHRLQQQQGIKAVKGVTRLPRPSC